MIQFLKKSFFYLLPALLFLFILECSLPFYWGNEDLIEKIEHVKENEIDFNTVFVGGSDVECHLIPTLFDSLVGQNIKSFNFGASNMHFMESRYFVKHIGKSEAFKDVKNVFIKMAVPRGIDTGSYGTIRSRYYVDFSSLMLSLHFFHDYTLYVGQIYRHVSSFLQKTFSIGEIESKIRFHIDEHKVQEKRVEDNGFLDLEYLLVEKKNKGLFYRRKYLTDTNKGKYLNGVNFVALPKTLRREPNYTYKKWIKELLSMQDYLEENGKNCYFIVEVNKPFHIFFDIKELNALYMGDAIENKEMYEVDNRIDVAHLNRTGAVFYTKKLATIFNNKFTK